MRDWECGSWNKSGLQDSERENPGNDDLGLEIQLYVPEHWDWDQGENPVGDDSHDGEGVGCSNNAIWVDALARHVRVPLKCNCDRDVSRTEVGQLNVEDTYQACIGTYRTGRLPCSRG